MLLKLAYSKLRVILQHMGKPLLVIDNHLLYLLLYFNLKPILNETDTPNHPFFVIRINN